MQYLAVNCALSLSMWSRPILCMVGGMWRQLYIFYITRFIDFFICLSSIRCVHVVVRKNSLSPRFTNICGLYVLCSSLIHCNNISASMWYSTMVDENNHPLQTFSFGENPTANLTWVYSIPASTWVIYWSLNQLILAYYYAFTSGLLRTQIDLVMHELSAEETMPYIAGQSNHACMLFSL